jgi:hypothetical protein
LRVIIYYYGIALRQAGALYSSRPR